MDLHVSARIAFLALGSTLLSVAGAPAARASSAPQASSTPQAKRTWDERSVEALKGVTAVAISPDAAYVAYTLSVPRIAGKDDDGAPWSELHVLDRAGERDRTFVGGKVNVSSVAWMPKSDALTFLAKREGDKQTALYTIALAGGEAQKLVELETSISDYALSPDGARAALVAPIPETPEAKKLTEKGFKQIVFEEDARVSGVFVADLAPGAAKPRRLEIDGHVHHVAWSPVDARLAVSVAPTPLVDDEYMRQRIRIVSADDGRELARIENPGKLGAFEWSPDGRLLALASAADLNDPSAGRLMVAPATGGAPWQVLDPDYLGDAPNFAWQSPNEILFVASHGTRTSFEQVELKEDHGAGTRVLISEGSGLAFTAVSLSQDGQHGAFVASTAAHPPEVFTASHGDPAPRRRTNSNPWTTDFRFAPQEIVIHKARDGVELQGILIRPLDEEKGRRYPLILCVHGGPEAHESNGWLTNYARPGQIAAARGMAVFYPNYRGSTGRGVAFSKLGQGDAAGREFDDLVDAVDHLIASGLVDKDKVGVTGGSYGGYATAWCSTKFTDRFAAGVMFVGISNKLSKVGTTDIPDEEYYVHARKRPWEELEFFLERSPIRHTENARTPLLILGGKDDTRVDPGQSKELYRWLKLRGKAPVRLVQYPGEGHGNRKACARLDYCVRMMQWMEHYLKGPGGAMPPYAVTYPEPATAR